jgi:hypothetical protein
VWTHYHIRAKEKVQWDLPGMHRGGENYTKEAKGTF